MQIVKNSKTVIPLTAVYQFSKLMNINVKIRNRNLSQIIVLR